MKAMMIGAAALAAATGLMAASPAAAQANVMKECSAKYQAAKTAKTLPAGQTWMQFLAQCRGSAKTAAAAPAKPMPAAPAKPVATATSATKSTAVHSVSTSTTTTGRTPAQNAEVSRQKQCGTMWKADKAAGKTGTMTWPQYWSACSKRLKGAA